MAKAAGPALPSNWQLSDAQIRALAKDPVEVVRALAMAWKILYYCDEHAADGAHPWIILRLPDKFPEARHDAFVEEMAQLGYEGGLIEPYRADGAAMQYSFDVQPADEGSFLATSTD